MSELSAARLKQNGRFKEVFVELVSSSSSPPPPALSALTDCSVMASGKVWPSVCLTPCSPPPSLCHLLHLSSSLPFTHHHVSHTWHWCWGFSGSETCFIAGETVSHCDCCWGAMTRPAVMIFCCVETQSVTNEWPWFPNPICDLSDVHGSDQQHVHLLRLCKPAITGIIGFPGLLYPRLRFLRGLCRVIKFPHMRESCSWCMCLFVEFYTFGVDLIPSIFKLSPPPQEQLSVSHP